ncbi:MAG: tetratricopeptide repeat protein [Gammaproteobacteria bacterium]|jgi:tetratricopeptide (TPR) repeat protein
MSRFSNHLILLLAAMLVACSSVPEPAPAPEPAPVEQAAPEPAPPPIDYNQQYYEQAVAELKKGDTEDAIELLVRVSGDAPDKPFVFTNLGLAYFKLEQYEPAEKAFQEAVTRNARDAVAYNHLGILQRRKGQFEEARKSYQRALDIDSNYALAHLNLGILFDIYLQDLEPALRHYQRYQALISEENKQVAGWIVDLERRLQSGAS